MRYLLDTCVVSELTKKRPAGKVVGWVGAQDESALFLSVITFGEIQKGIGKLPDGRKRKRLQTWVDTDLAKRFTGRILDVGLDVACRWGQLAADAEKNGRRIPVLDGLIAATAFAAGLTVATRNTADMEATGVPLLDPWAL
ncbi:MAG: type II toxin-antitoxin system VapC family toxin [Kiritimatiellae bacterium]|nr:type II toxin-antitoxin system VapC family toxin [Kiritimatiellia bacterium]